VGRRLELSGRGPRESRDCSGGIVESSSYSNSTGRSLSPLA
jgi:hypothetical protein